MARATATVNDGLTDGRVRVEVGRSDVELTLSQARRFAAAITAAADDLGALCRAHPLDRFSTVGIIEEIARRRLRRQVRGSRFPPLQRNRPGRILDGLKLTPPPRRATPQGDLPRLIPPGTAAC